MITPEDNVFILRFIDLPKPDDESLEPDPTVAEPPKELRHISTEPEELIEEADEDEGETVEEIENNEIDEPQEEDNSLIMPSAKFIYNAKDLRDLEDKISRNLTTRATYSIVDELELPAEEFEAFTSDFGKDYDFLNSFRPRRTDATYDCILVSGEGSDVKLLIDPSGTPRAKFVSIL